MILEWTPLICSDMLLFKLSSTISLPFHISLYFSTGTNICGLVNSSITSSIVLGDYPKRLPRFYLNPRDACITLPVTFQIGRTMRLQVNT